MGVGSFIAVLGLTSTANAQVSDTFTARDATELTVEFRATSYASTFQPDAEASVEHLEGVVSAGTYAYTKFTVQRTRFSAPVTGGSIPVMAASAGYWRTVGPTVADGRTFDQALEEHQVAVLGQRAADTLGIEDVGDQPRITINSQSFTVIGIVSDADREGAAISTAVMIPLRYAHTQEPDLRDQMIVSTELGAVEAAAKQVPTAIDPIAPGSLAVSYTPRAKVIDNEVSDQLRALFLSLAAVCLFVGAVGIANVSMISVMERVPEIGLRRALGALPRHVLLQFLMEAALLGFLGGLTGGVIGELVVVTVSSIQDWTPVMETWLLAASAPVGIAIGTLAGAYPAGRAARIDPVEAFRR